MLSYLILLALLGTTLTYAQQPGFIVKPDKPEYFHYEFINITGEVKDTPILPEWKHLKIPCVLLYNYNVVSTIGDKELVYLVYSSSTSRWEGKWPCPWNAPAGEYTINVRLPEQIRQTTGIEVKTDTFKIKRRPIPPLPEDMRIITLEDIRSFSSFRVRGPDGELGDWRKLLDWVSLSGADTFWCLAGVTAYYTKKLNPEYPFIKQDLTILSEVGKECHRRGIKFGVWAMAYLTFGKSELKPPYKWAINYTNGTLDETRSISISDSKRVDHLIAFYKQINTVPEIDYIGIDYIRNALGGYELVNEFVRDMKISVPENWADLSKDQRMVWLAKKKIARKDKPFIDQWQWWRAHKCSYIIKRIVDEVKLTKPFWAFTLSWEKGWQHGQDPIMFSDAGIDIDAIMLYECTRSQFDELIRDWNRYTKRGDVNLVVGDTIDWPLHQSTINPAGPEEFYDRIMQAVDKIYADGTANGIFLHCLARALWGRKGPYPTAEWLYAGGMAFTQLRIKKNTVPFIPKIVTSKNVTGTGTFKVTVVLDRNSLTPPSEITVKFLETPGIKYKTGREQKIGWDITQSSIVVTNTAINDTNHPARGSRYMLATEISWLNKDKPDRVVLSTYVSPKLELTKKSTPEIIKEVTGTKEKVSKPTISSDMVLSTGSVPGVNVIPAEAGIYGNETNEVNISSKPADTKPETNQD